MQRPSDFREYIGQSATKRRLEIEIYAAKTENRCLPHILFAAQPGLGKTSLSKLIAKQFDKELVATTGPAIQNEQALVAKLKTLGPGGFIFIDELHKMRRKTQEYLLVVLEEFEIDEEVTVNGEKVLRKTKLPPFTVIGATTRTSDIDSAFRERFGIRETLEPYTVAEICEIIRRSLIKRGYEAEEQAIIDIAMRSRHTPRTALALTNSLLSYALYNKTTTLSWSLVDEYFAFVNKIDCFGLNDFDRRVLRVLLEGPLSLKHWASKAGESAVELETVHEPYYSKIGVIRTDSKGRCATPKLMSIFGIPGAQPAQAMV